MRQNQISPNMEQFGMWVQSLIISGRTSRSNASLTFRKEAIALLMGLLSGDQRSQTLHSLNIEDIKILGDKCIIPIMQKIKQTRPWKHMKPLIFNPFQYGLF